MNVYQMGPHLFQHGQEIHVPALKTPRPTSTVQNVQPVPMVLNVLPVPVVQVYHNATCMVNATMVYKDKEHVHAMLMSNMAA